MIDSNKPAETPGGDRPKQRLEHLDMIRGLAALAVCVGHIRSFVFVDYSSLPPGHEYQIPFYFLTGLGGQAVMIFFALSGFLVGGPALDRINRRKWDFPDYTIHRFSRLWTSLIPALLVTALIDWTGRDLLHLVGYAGEYRDMLAGGPAPGEGTSLALTTFLGNVAFLMNVTVPVFGTDGPLWSLAYEFAYYFAIPLGWLAVRGGAGIGWRLLAAAIAVSALILYPRTIVGLSSIWLAGALVYLLVPHVQRLPHGWFRLLFALAGLALVVSFPLTLKGGHTGNVVFGCACAATLPFLTSLRNRGGAYGRASFWLSEMSFTLYVVHFPFALFLWFWLAAPTQYTLGVTGLAIWAGILAATLAYVFMMWWLFERNTGRVRKWAQRRLLRRG